MIVVPILFEKDLTLESSSECIILKTRPEE